MCNEIFKLERKVKDTGDSELFLRVPMEILKNALLSNLTGNEFKAFVAIATFIDDKGECNPSQATLSILTSMSLPTVNTVVNTLLKKRIGESPILLRTLVGRGSTKYSKYRIPMLNETIIPEISTEVNLTSTEIMKLYRDKYEETFGVPYKPDYRKDMSMIKNALLPNYTDEQIKAMIETVFQEFDKRWKTPVYQAPTIGALCSWLGNQALKLWADREKAKTSVSKWDDCENDEESLDL